MKLQELINKLHKYERGSVFVNDLFNAVFIVISSIDSMVEDIKKEFFFDTITIGLKACEKLLKIQPSVNATIDERRSAIRAKWRANGKNTMKLIQDICNSWDNGEIEAHFVQGKIKLQFVGSYGIPTKDALQALINQIEEMIPAHIGYFWQYKFLLKKDIHHVLTKNQMQQLEKNKYCGVKVNE